MGPSLDSALKVGKDASTVCSQQFYCRGSITTIAMLAYANRRISQPFWQSSEVSFKT